MIWALTMNMKGSDAQIQSVAIIGAGASGAVTAAAFKSEGYFNKIRIFERREMAGGTWIYDASSPKSLPITPGGLPPSTDPPISIPVDLPMTSPHIHRERFSKTPIYSSLTTNVPSIAMSYSDLAFAYGPFVPHYIPRQYIEGYISHHQLDSFLVLNTTVEDVSKLPNSRKGEEKWKLTLRRYDPVRNVDEWWEENFDAVVIANGHYAIPFIPKVKGLDEYLKLFPGRVVHSKTYRSPQIFAKKRVLIIGNSASGHDLTAEIISTAHLPVFQSRRTASRWEGDEPPEGIAWKPIIIEFLPSGRILFDDGSWLDGIDTIVYCTGYLPSFPFWNAETNGREIFSYEKNRLLQAYQHTFFQDFKTLAIVGIPRVLTFRSFEYQAVALARLWSGRNAAKLPPVEEMRRWETEREKKKKVNRQKFHDIVWEGGETLDWLQSLYDIAGLPRLTGEGRTPPVLGADVRWAIEHLRKYPEPGKGKKGLADEEVSVESGNIEDEAWVVVERAQKKDLLHYI